MSRVGRMPIPVPSGTKVELKNGAVHVDGPKGKVTQKLIPGFPVEVKDGQILVSRSGDTGPERAKHGLMRALLNNAVNGAAVGYTKQLDIVGVGYKAELRGQEVHFALGYSHPVVFKVPSEVKVEVEPKTFRITVTGADRQLVGQVAAQIRMLRDPDPYKQKGVRYVGERLRKKAGKAGGK